MEKFSEKVVLVTGAAKNLGAATALAFTGAGARVIVNYRRTRPSEKSAKQASAVFRADVTSEKDVKRMAGFIKNKFGRLDILVNNVGDFLFKPIEKTSAKEFLDVLENNLISSHLMTSVFLPLFKKSKIPAIVNIAAAGADDLTTPMHTTPYYIAKTGVVTLTRAYARKLAKYKIRVNCVSPGILQSSVIKGRRMPFGRYASFDDVTRAIFWLADPENSYISGANIEVSGGWKPLTYLCEP